MIVVIPKVLSESEAILCRQRLEKADWRDGRQTAGPLAAMVKKNRQLADDDPLATEIGALLLSRLASTNLFVSAALPQKVVPPRFNLYVDQAYYGDHIDSAVFAVPGSSDRIRADLSATLFLSNPDEYDGGELTVAGEFALNRIKLPAGHMVLYSSGAVHRVEPVTRGARFAAFFWIQSLVREKERRSVLFELDDTIQSLTAETPGNPAIGRLTSIYHNLLRDWAIA